MGNMHLQRTAYDREGGMNTSLTIIRNSEVGQLIFGRIISLFFSILEPILFTTSKCQ